MCLRMPGCWRTGNCNYDSYDVQRHNYSSAAWRALVWRAAARIRSRAATHDVTEEEVTGQEK